MYYHLLCKCNSLLWNPITSLSETLKYYPCFLLSSIPSILMMTYYRSYNIGAEIPQIHKKITRLVVAFKTFL